MSLSPFRRPLHRGLSVALVAFLAAAALALAAWQWPSSAPPPRPRLVTRHLDHERARAEWFLRDRRALDHRLPAAHLLRAFQQRRLIPHIYPRPWSPAIRRELFGARRLASAQAAPLPTAGNWTELGPSPQTGMEFIQVSGRITTLALDPSDATGNTVYLGAAYGGIWQSTNALSASPTWTPISDGTPSLAIGAIALLPGTTPPVVIAGTGEQNNSLDSYYGVGFERGVYDSATSTWNWTTITTATSACGGCAGTSNGQTIPLLGLAFAKILVVPGTDTVLAAGGSSADISSTSSLTNQYYRGIYRSTDGGQTWSLVYTQSDANGPNYSCTGLVFDPKNGYVYAALRGHGIYQSTDAGATWAPVATPTPFVNPASVNLDQEFHRASLAVDSKGDLFTIVTDINGKLATPTACSAGATACDTGIWESPDGGKTWNPIASPTCGNLDAKYTQTCSTADPLFNADNQGEYDMYIAVPPGSNTLVVGGIDVWSATPDGMSTAWTNLTLAYGPGIVHPDQHAIAFVNANTWFIGNDGGIWSTTNAGDPGAAGTTNAGSTAAWTDLNNGLGTIQLISATPDPSQPGVYTGGSQDNGTVVSTASTGKIWGLGWGGDGGNTAIDPAQPQDYFSENSYVPAPPGSGGPFPIIVASTNGGKPTNYTGQGSSQYPPCGWPGNGNFTNDMNVLANCLPSYAPILDTNLLAENGDFYLPFQLIPNDTSTMLLATCRLWMGPAIPAAPDQGWVPISPDLTTDNVPAGACGADYIQDFAAAPDDPNEIIAVTTDGQVQLTNFALQAPPIWTSRTISPLPTGGSLPFGAIAIDPSDSLVAYLGVQGFVAGTSYGHVYMTANSGGSWTDITGNLPDSPVNAIVVDPEIPNDIYIGTDVGVFVATDSGVSGENWQQMGSGLPSSAVLSLKIDDATRTLIAATHGRGAWAIPLLGTPQPDFALTTPDAIVYPDPTTNTVQVTVTAVAQAGFAQPITINCDHDCTPATVNPGSSVTMTVPTNGLAAEPIEFTGTSAGIGHSLSVISIPAGFALNATPSDPVVTAGQSATVTASIFPQGPFTGTVDLSCPGSGDGITCSVSPASVQIANGKVATATVTLTTTAASTLPPIGGGRSHPWLWASLAALALALAAAAFAAARRGRRFRLAYWLAPVILAGFLLMAACGGNSAGLPPASIGGGGGSTTPATPSGSYIINLQAASGSQTQSFGLDLTVH